MRDEIDPDDCPRFNGKIRAIVCMKDLASCQLGTITGPAKRITPTDNGLQPQAAMTCKAPCQTAADRPHVKQVRDTWVWIWTTSVQDVGGNSNGACKYATVQVVRKTRSRKADRERSQCRPNGGRNVLSELESPVASCKRNLQGSASVRMWSQHPGATGSAARSRQPSCPCSMSPSVATTNQS